MKVVRKRGSNSVTFEFGERKVSSIVRALRTFRGNIIRYLSYKMKSPYGGSVPPLDVLIRIRHGYEPATVKKHEGDERYYDYTYTANYWSNDNQTRPTPVAITNYAAGLVENFSDLIIDKREVNPNRNYEVRDDYRIKSLTITWFYPKRLP